MGEAWWEVWSGSGDMYQHKVFQKRLQELHSLGCHNSCSRILHLSSNYSDQSQQSSLGCESREGGFLASDHGGQPYGWCM